MPLSDFWELLVDGVCRPPRDDQYTVEDLVGGNASVYQIGEATGTRQELTLVNHRGSKLACSHYRPSHVTGRDGKLPCVIYAHCNSGSRRDAEEAIFLLIPLGISVFAVDFAGSGVSDGEWVSLGLNEAGDLEAVVAYLQAAGHTSSIGLWGRSMGAVTALLYAARNPGIAGMVLDSPFCRLTDLITEVAQRLRLPIPRYFVKRTVAAMRRSVQKRANFDIHDVSPLDVASACTAPALFGHGTEDAHIDIVHSRKLHDAYGADERNILFFGGNHLTIRPPFWYLTAAVFFHRHLGVQDAVEAAAPLDLQTIEDLANLVAAILKARLPIQTPSPPPAPSTEAHAAPPPEADTTPSSPPTKSAAPPSLYSTPSSGPSTPTDPVLPNSPPATGSITAPFTPGLAIPSRPPLVTPSITASASSSSSAARPPPSRHPLASYTAAPQPPRPLASTIPNYPTSSIPSQPLEPTPVTDITHQAPFNHQSLLPPPSTWESSSSSVEDAPTVCPSQPPLGTPISAPYYIEDDEAEGSGWHVHHQTRTSNATVMCEYTGQEGHRSYRWRAIPLPLSSSSAGSSSHPTTTTTTIDPAPSTACTEAVAPTVPAATAANVLTAAAAPSSTATTPRHSNAPPTNPTATHTTTTVASQRPAASQRRRQAAAAGPGLPLAPVPPAQEADMAPRGSDPSPHRHGPATGQPGDTPTTAPTAAGSSATVRSSPAAIAAETASGSRPSAAACPEGIGAFSAKEQQQASTVSAGIMAEAQGRTTSGGAADSPKPGKSEANTEQQHASVAAYGVARGQEMREEGQRVGPQVQSVVRGAEEEQQVQQGEQQGVWRVQSVVRGAEGTVICECTGRGAHRRYRLRVVPPSEEVPEPSRQHGEATAPPFAPEALGQDAASPGPASMLQTGSAAATSGSGTPRSSTDAHGHVAPGSSTNARGSGAPGWTIHTREETSSGTLLCECRGTDSAREYRWRVIPCAAAAAAAAATTQTAGDFNGWWADGDGGTALLPSQLPPKRAAARQMPQVDGGSGAGTVSGVGGGVGRQRRGGVGGGGDQDAGDVPPGNAEAVGSSTGEGWAGEAGGSGGRALPRSGAVLEAAAGREAMQIHDNPAAHLLWSNSSVELTPFPSPPAPAPVPSQPLAATPHSAAALPLLTPPAHPQPATAPGDTTDPTDTDIALLRNLVGMSGLSGPACGATEEALQLYQTLDPKTLSSLINLHTTLAKALPSKDIATTLQPAPPTCPAPPIHLPTITERDEDTHQDRDQSKPSSDRSRTHHHPTQTPIHKPHHQAHPLSAPTPKIQPPSTPIHPPTTSQPIYFAHPPTHPAMHSPLPPTSTSTAPSPYPPTTHPLDSSSKPLSLIPSARGPPASFPIASQRPLATIPSASLPPSRTVAPLNPPATGSTPSSSLQEQPSKPACLRCFSKP